MSSTTLLSIILFPCVLCILTNFYWYRKIKQVDKEQSFLEKSVKEILEIFDDDWR